MIPWGRYDDDGCVADFPVGSFVVLKDGTQLLVGHINKRGGQCGCCNIGDIAGIEPSLSDSKASGTSAAAGKDKESA